jgi:hypothetical protein
MPRRDPLQTDPTLANRFLAHQLTEEERERLEVELLLDPEIVEELEATARFKAGLQKLRETGELDVLLAPPPRSNHFRLLAAAVLVVGIGVFLLRPTAAPSGVLTASLEQLVDSGGRVLSSSRTYSVLRQRTTVNRTEIELPAAREAIKLRILPRPDLMPPYLVSLVEIRAQGEPVKVGSIAVARADEEGRVTVFADSGRLSSGSYVLIVTGSAKTDNVEDTFPIDVAPADEIRSQ